MTRNPYLVRNMRCEDIPAAVQLKDAEGWNQTAADWEQLLSSSPDGCFAAESEGEVVGTAATITYEGKVAWVGMVVVHPQYRGRGVGKTLLETALRHLDSRRVPSVKLDATPEGKILYKRLGFASEYGIERWVLRRAPKDGVSGQPLLSLRKVLELDREGFGVDRGAILRHMASNAPQLCLARSDAEHVTGFAFGRAGALADHLGPWMAHSKVAAGALLDEFLSRSTRGQVFVDCVQPNPWAIELVESRGFVFSRALTRMFRGSNAYPGRSELVCSIVGPEFG